MPGTSPGFAGVAWGALAAVPCSGASSSGPVAAARTKTLAAARTQSHPRRVCSSPSRHSRIALHCIALLAAGAVHAAAAALHLAAPLRLCWRAGGGAGGWVGATGAASTCSSAAACRIGRAGKGGCCTATIHASFPTTIPPLKARLPIICTPQTSQDMAFGDVAALLAASLEVRRLWSCCCMGMGSWADLQWSGFSGLSPGCGRGGPAHGDAQPLRQ